MHLLLFGGEARWTDADAPFHQLLIMGIHANGFWQDVPWLPHTILGDAGPDHHWLWHLTLSPLAAIDDLATRIDLMNALGFALVPASTYLALRLLGARHAWFWVLVLVAGTDWTLFRWSMARAQDPACAIMVLFIAALARRHRPALFILPFLLMNTYHGAAILAAPGLLYFAMRWARERRPDPALVLLPAAGALAALVANPWFPRDVEYFLFHTLVKVGDAQNIDVGLEWHAARPRDVFLGLLPQLSALAIALVGARAAIHRQLTPLAFALLGVSALFYTLAILHGRFIEYCPQVLVLAAALVARDCAGSFAGQVRSRFVAAAGAAALLSFTASAANAATFRVTAWGTSFERNQAVGALLSRVAAPGTLIANTEWGDFPTLAWHAPGLRYLYGLDPYYLAYEDEARFIALYDLRGIAPYATGRRVDVRTELGSDWVVTKDPRIVDRLIADGQARVVLKDRWSQVVYVGSDETVAAWLLREGAQSMQVAWPRRHDDARAVSDGPPAP